LTRKLLVTKPIVKFIRRLIKFPQKTWKQKFSTVASRWARWLPGVPLPWRLPIGVWWINDFDFLDNALQWQGFEDTEYNFAGLFLKPGMKVLDIGAHRGFYTLLFSKKIGPEGRVIAFEPSPRERKKLNRHLSLNRSRNVEVLGCALGESDGIANLYVVNGLDSGCNSLQPPDTDSPTSAVAVRVRKLDEVLAQVKAEKIDFIKLDVEGGELGVLKGAEELLKRVPRPVILCEVLEPRTRPWGYPARFIIEHLVQRDFVWFELEETARMRRIEPKYSEYYGNFVAVPRESLETIMHLQARASEHAAGKYH
jgi:FkbM family methyltransferase